MIRLTCPLCGERDHTEFRYGGDASKERPAHEDVDAAAWHDHVFLFDNPMGRHLEFWQHVLGCRHWMIVERDTLTNEITATGPARTGRPAGAGHARTGEGGVA